jgi:hypothetical protein
LSGLRKYKSLYSSTSSSFGTGEGVTITPASVTGLPTTTIVLTFDRVDSTGTATPTKMERIKGTVSGGNFVVASGGRGYDGSTEQAHTSPVVEMIWNATDWNDLVDALTNVVSATTGSLDTTKVVDLTTAQTLINKVLSDSTTSVVDALDATKILKFDVTGTTGVTGTVTSAFTTAKTVTLPDATDTLVGKATTDTLTNKRITKRVGSTTSSATPTINTDNVDIYRLTAQAADITSFTTNLSGTPVEGDMLLIEITGTAARAITWGTSFESSTVTLPTTTVTTNMLQVLFKWNSSTSKWRCIASV